VENEEKKIADSVMDGVSRGFTDKLHSVFAAAYENRCKLDKVRLSLEGQRAAWLSIVRGDHVFLSEMASVQIAGIDRVLSDSVIGNSEVDKIMSQMFGAKK